MLYLNDGHMEELGVDWPAVIAAVEKAVQLLRQGDYVQPLKPYLRYGNPDNRIIAMPAFAGGEVYAAGIKWIASFPGNLERGLPRAHNVTVLNDPDTGRPVAVLQTAAISAIRTAAVSGLVLGRYMKARKPGPVKLALLGYGPIGRTHLRMCEAVLQEDIAEIRLFDIRGIDPESVPAGLRDKTSICAGWKEAYADADIILTCTVAGSRYIDEKPKKGGLLLHVSLRDYQAEALKGISRIVVDDWHEVCRENTDIELLAKEHGLAKEQTVSLAEAVSGKKRRIFSGRETVLFAPMGMALFDIAMASYYVGLAEERGVGIELL